MDKEERLKRIIEAIKYISKIDDDDIALGYAIHFEKIADDWATSEINILQLKNLNVSKSSK